MANTYENSYYAKDQKAWRAWLAENHLQGALENIPKALDYFMAFPPSTKRGILEWIFNAKRPATRAKRILETATLAGENIRANQYRQPKKSGLK